MQIPRKSTANDRTTLATGNWRSALRISSIGKSDFTGEKLA
jgi:hypothetical protein